MVAATTAPRLSVVIPAYNEALRLGPTIEEVVAYLRAQPWASELIVVDDGSSDRTAELARELLDGAPISHEVLVNERNRGKGYSVKRGMTRSTGELALFSDADLSTPIEHTADLMAAIEAGADIAIGSRVAPGADIEVHQPLLREMAGRMFSVVQRGILGSGIKDTQCGFKMFTREAVELVSPHQRLERWAFDAELIFIALRLGLRVVEVPVHWRNDAESKVSALTDGMQMVADLAAIRRMHAGLRPIRRKRDA